MADMCAPQVTDGNLGIAFGLVTAAGLSTSVGAGLAFVMPFSNSGKNLFLAASLGIAAGVMTYVSFVEIFTAKSIPAFEACVGEQYAYLYGTLCFFAGLALTRLFDEGLHLLQKRITRGGKRKDEPTIMVDVMQSVVESAVMEEAVSRPWSEESEGKDVEDPNTSRDGSSTETAAVEGTVPTVSTGEDNVTAEPSMNTSTTFDVLENRLDVDHSVGHDGHMVAEVYRETVHDSKRLARMGVFAGLGESSCLRFRAVCWLLLVRTCPLC